MLDNAFDVDTSGADADLMVTRGVDVYILFEPGAAYPVVLQEMRDADPPVPTRFADGLAPEGDDVWHSARGPASAAGQSLVEAGVHEGVSHLSVEVGPVPENLGGRR